jgi:hypothetical protein
MREKYRRDTGKEKGGIRDEGTEETDPLLISPYVFH